MKKFLLPLGILFFGIVAVAPSLYFYRQYHEIQKQLKDAGGDDVAALVKKISRHVLLPDTETPTVLTVTDKDKLSGQQFFAHAQNGDKVLVYAVTKKAFLYDVIHDRVLEIGPVLNTHSATETASLESAPTEGERPMRYMLLNGSAVTGLTKQVQDAILKLYPKAKIIDRDTAKAVYEHSMLVDMKGNFSTIAATIAKSLNVTLSSLPAAEATSGAGYDLLLIAGKDWK